MARVNPTDPLESIDIRDRTLPTRTKIGRIKRTLFNIGEDYEDPKVQFKYYRIMAARYGDGFVITRRQSGNLWSWGCSATEGQLGTGETTPTTTPTLIETGELDFSRVFATGKAHTIALDVSGAPYTWGDNQYGQLGDGYTINRSSPSAAKGNILGRAAAAGLGHSLVIDQDDSKAWAWGLNNYGQLGIGDTTNRYSPEEVTLGTGRKFRKIDAGDKHTITLDQMGQIWTWGSNQYGQLGRGAIENPVLWHEFSNDLTDSIGSADASWFSTPLQFENMENYGKAVGPGEEGKGIVGAYQGISGNQPWTINIWTQAPSAALGSTNGLLFYYGNLSGTNRVIEIFYNESSNFFWASFYNEGPGPFPTPPGGWVRGDEYMLTLSWDGTYTNLYTNGVKSTPYLNTNPLNIALGDFQMMSLNGSIVFTYFGLLGDVKVWERTLTDEEIGNLYISGDIYTNSNLPTSAADANFIEVAAGSQSSYGIDKNGQAWAWGDNQFGQLGDNTVTAHFSPVSVLGRHSFIHVTAGGRESEGHACALKPDGSVWCWGRNHHGQAGSCDYADKSTPTSVVGRHSFIDVWVAKDGYSTIAIKLDGSVWVWGQSPFCNGVDYCSPVSIPDFNLITLNILGRGYLEDHSNILEI